MPSPSLNPEIITITIINDVLDLPWMDHDRLQSFFSSICEKKGFTVGNYLDISPGSGVYILKSLLRDDFQMVDFVGRIVVRGDAPAGEEDYSDMADEEEEDYSDMADLKLSDDEDKNGP